MKNPEIKKIYDIKIAGVEEAILHVNDLGDAFKKLRAVKIALNKEMSQAIASNDTSSIENLRAKIAELQKQMRSLAEERRNAVKEADALIKSEKAEADIKVKDAQATLLQAKANKENSAADILQAKATTERTQAEKILADVKVKGAQATLLQDKANKEKVATDILQAKELDRLADKQEKQAKAAEKEKNAVQALPGSYKALYAEYKRLNDQLRLTPETAPQFKDLHNQVKDLKTEVDNFNRSLIKEGTLVGEYSKGILDAFSKAGLTDLIKHQGDQLKAEISKLDQEFVHLQQDISKVGVDSNGAFQNLEKQMIENRQEAGKLAGQLENVNVSLKGVGGIGSQVTDGLKNGFKEARGQLAQFVLGYVGFQAALSSVQSLIATNVEFEKKGSEVQAITGIAGDGLEKLKQKALETSSVTRFSSLEILESYKLIAGAKPELASSAESLDKVKDAAVTLAQAASSDLPEAVSGLLDTLNQFGAGTEQATEFVDALAAGAKFGAAEIPAISTALKEFGTQAASSNVSIHESVGLIELLASKGIQGAEAGTKLRNVLLALNAAPALGRKALAELDEAGVNIDKLGDNTIFLQERLTELAKVQNNNTALVKVFGKENFNAGQIVLQNIPAYIAFTNQVKATGVAQEQAAINTDNASTKLAKVANQLKNAFTSEGVVATIGAIATALSFLLIHLSGLLVIIGPLAVYFGLYNAQLTIAAFRTGTLSKETLSYFLLSKLQAAQIAIVTALTAAQNFILTTYTALTVRATLATGASAVALRVLAVAFRFLTGPVGIALTLLVGLTTVFGILSAKAKSTATAISEAAIKTAAYDAINKEANKNLAAQLGTIDSYVRILKDAKSSVDAKKFAVEQLTKSDKIFGDVMKDNVVDLKKLDDAYKKVTESIRTKERALATGKLTAEKEAIVTQISTLRKRLEIEVSQSKLSTANLRDLPEEDVKTLASVGQQTRDGNADISKNIALKLIDKLKVKETQAIQVLQAYNSIKNEAEKELDTTVKKAATESAKKDEVNIEFLKSQIDALNKDIDSFSGTKADLKKKIQERDKLQQELNELLNKSEKEKKYSGSKLTGEQKDAFKDIDANKDELLAAEKLKFEQLEISESDYLKNIFKINSDAADAKLALIKGKNAEERKTIAELHLFKIDQEQATNDRLFEIEAKQLKENFTTQKDALERQRDIVLNNPESDPVQKLEAQIQYDVSFGELQTKFFTDQLALENNYHEKSEQTERDAAKAQLDITDQKNKDTYALNKAAYERDRQQANDAHQIAVDDIKSNLAQTITQTLEKKALTDGQKAIDIAKAQNIAKKQLLEEEVRDAKIEYDKLAAQQDYSLEHLRKVKDAKVRYDEAMQKSTEASVKKQLSLWEQFSSSIGGLFGSIINLFKKQTNEQGIELTKQEKQAKGTEAGIAAGLKALQQAASEAFNNYFINQAASFDKEAEIAKKRIDLQQKQAEALATSESEKEAIQKKYDKKRADADKKAGEEKKKLALKRMAIEFAIAVAKGFADYGWIGGAIAAVGLGVLYAVQRAQVQKQTFARGGNVPTKTGGMINGPSHAGGGVPFHPNMEAEGDEAYIINKKSMKQNHKYVISGTPMEIASRLNMIGGGVNFKPGGMMTKFGNGGMIGGSVKAPIFVPSTTPYEGRQADRQAIAAQEQVMNAIISQNQALMDVHNRIDRIQVQLNPNDVRKENSKHVKQTAIGRL